MADLSVQKITPAGVTLTYAGASVSGDKFVNDGQTKIHVINGGGSAVTVTVAAPGTCSFGVSGSAHALEVEVGAGADKWIGPFPIDRHNDGDNKVSVSYSAVSDVEIAVVR